VTGITSSGERIDRQGVILIVHPRHNPITLLDVSYYLGGFVGMQAHFLPSPLTTSNPVDAQQITLDCIAAFDWRPSSDRSVVFPLPDRLAYDQVGQPSFRPQPKRIFACAAWDRRRHSKNPHDRTPTTLGIENMGTSSVRCKKGIHITLRSPESCY
jgi:hypothetical protein